MHIQNIKITILVYFLAFLFGLSFSAIAEEKSLFLSKEEGRAVPRDQSEIRLSFASVVTRSARAVVNVYATRMVRQRRSPFAGDPFFERFFGPDAFGRPRERESSSLGSGVIVDASGIIVTNFHVIADATDIKVALSDRREFDAEIILRDQKSDLAVLEIQQKGEIFPHLDFASQNSLDVGDLVLAIGNPFGVGQTVTQGIVSALARTQAGISDSGFFLQTDAAINPGNSGGALVDMNGDIVGINTAIYSKSGGSIGIGFAIPSDMVKTVVNSALQGSNRVVRPWIGAQLQNVDADSALALGLSRPRGVLVTALFDEGPSDKAGLEIGDLILSVNGDAFDDENGFLYRLATLGIGQEAELKIIRGGREHLYRVSLVPAPETTPRDERLLKGRHPFAGAYIANLSPALAEEIRFSGFPEGVIVLDVERRSYARRFGLRKGDVILELNNEPVLTTDALEKMLQQKALNWRFKINRNGKILESDLIRG